MDAEAATGYSAARALPPGARPWIAACVLRWWLGIGTVIGLLLGLVAAALLSGWSGGRYAGGALLLGPLLGFVTGLLVAAPQAIILAAGARWALTGKGTQLGLAAWGVTVTVLFWYALTAVFSSFSFLAYAFIPALTVWGFGLAIGLHALAAATSQFAPANPQPDRQPQFYPAAMSYPVPPPIWVAPAPAAEQPQPAPQAPPAPAPQPRPTSAVPSRRERLLSHHRPANRVGHPRA